MITNDEYRRQWVTWLRIRHERAVRRLAYAQGEVDDLREALESLGEALESLGEEPLWTRGAGACAAWPSRSP